MKNKCSSWRGKTTVRPRCQGREGLTFIGAQRRPLAGKAGGSGVRFGQEGHFGFQWIHWGKFGIARVEFSKIDASSREIL